jgi:hypothetical protein
MPLRFAPALPAQPFPKCGRGGRRPARVRRQPPCRPSLVALLASCRTVPFVSGGALRRPRRVLHVRTDPGEGAVERRQAHSFFRSRVRGATTLSRGDRDLSRRSTVAVFGCGPTKPAPGSGTPEPQRLPAPAVNAWRSGSGPPALRFRAAAWDATPRSAFRIVSGDAPHERGYESCIA